MRDCNLLRREVVDQRELSETLSPSVLTVCTIIIVTRDLVTSVIVRTAGMASCYTVLIKSRLDKVRCSKLSYRNIHTITLSYKWWPCCEVLVWPWYWWVAIKPFFEVVVCATQYVEVWA
jgi:hypothetical protein